MTTTAPALLYILLATGVFLPSRVDGNFDGKSDAPRKEEQQHAYALRALMFCML